MFHILIYSIIKFCFIFLCYTLNLINYNTYIKNICYILSDINVYYVKIFQWQLFDKENTELHNFFKDYTNNVKYTDKDIDLKSLFNLVEYANKNNNKIIIDSYKPINSGTVSLVFKGTLNDTPIAIKMLRNDIKNKIIDCLNITEYIINILQKLSWLFNYNIKITNITNNIQECLIEQCDFIKEVDNLELFYDVYKNTKDIVIPKVYKDYTYNNNKIIVMNYLEGKNIHDLKEDELNNYSKIFNKYIIKSILVKRIINNDFHSGNIIFMNEDNNLKIGLIDLGMIKKINNFEYNILSSIFFLLVEENYEKLFRVLITKCITININSDELIDILVQKLVDKKNKNEIIIDGFLSNNDFENIIKTVNENITENSNIKKEILELLLGLISNLNVLQILTKKQPLHKVYKKYLIPSKLEI